MNSDKKVAIITGGSRGIGKALAIEFAKAGYDLVVADIAFASADGTTPDVVKEASAFGAAVVDVRCDVTQESQVAELFKVTEEKFKRLDVLVNNVGITNDKLVMRMSYEDFTKVININLNSSFLTSKAAIKMMSKTGGAIVNMSSVVGLMGNAGQANYCASKAGMIGMTKSMAKEYGGRGIRVNAVAPGFIETDMTAKLSDEVKNKYMEIIPMKRFGSVSEVASVVLFLASPAASYVNGQVITIDGGMYM